MTKEEKSRLIDILDAYANGKTIQYKCKSEPESAWQDVPATTLPLWHAGFDYRIKPSESRSPRRINIKNPEELKRFKMETTGFVSSYGFPYRLDDLTDKGANYTIFCPLRWKNAFPPAKLHRMLREDVDADRIRVEYVDFVNEDDVVVGLDRKAETGIKLS